MSRESRSYQPGEKDAPLLPPSTHSLDDPRSARKLIADAVTEYAHERPEVVALWAFGIGFVLGWKMKLW